MNVNIETYRPEWQPYFEQFNKAWLEEYFVVEDIDKWVLENPEEAILQKGGRILFALYGDAVIGTIALRLIEPGVYELTKMAVDKKYQGFGAGKLLCTAAIEEVKKLDACKLILYSQTRLAAAIHIYRSLGFLEVGYDNGIYVRADIKMEMRIRSVPDSSLTNVKLSQETSLTQS